MTARFVKVVALLIMITLVFTGCQKTSQDNNSPVSGQNSPEENYNGNSTANINNLGLMAFQGEWIYFNLFNNSYIVKMKEDGSEKTILIGPESGLGGISCIQVVGDWLYFQSDIGFYKMKTDGSELTRILEEDKNFWAYVIGEYIYYVENKKISEGSYTYELVRVNTSGADRKVLFAVKDHFYAIDNMLWIIQANEDGIIFGEAANMRNNIDAIWHVDLNGDNPKKLTEYKMNESSDDGAEIAEQFKGLMLFDGENIFYHKEESGEITYISSFNTNSLEDKKIIKAQGVNVYDINGNTSVVTSDYCIRNIIDGKYVGTYQNELAIFSKDLKKIEKISSDPAGVIFINKENTDWIYYTVSDQLYRIHKDGTGREQIEVADDPKRYLPKVRIVDNHGADGFLVYDDDNLVWDSKQGNFIGCVGDTYYYIVDKQMRYINLKDKTEQIIVEDSPGYAIGVNKGPDYILLGFSGYDPRFITIMKGGSSTPDTMDIDADIDVPVMYENGWLYLAMNSTYVTEGFSSPMFFDVNSLCRIPIDKLPLGNQGKKLDFNYEKAIQNNSGDCQVLYPSFYDRSYVVVDRNVYVSKSTNPSAQDDEEDDLCIKINADSMKEEVIYQFPATDGLDKLEGITSIVRLEDKIIFYAKYMDGKLISHKACIYDMTNGTVEILNVNGMIPNVFQIPDISPKQIGDRFFVIETTFDGTYVYGCRFNDNGTPECYELFQTEPTGARLFDSDGEVFMTNGKKLYYYNRKTDEFVAYPLEYNRIEHVEIIG